MNIVSIMIAAVAVGGTGVILGLFLGFFGSKFKVEVDERETFIREELPGNNCGGCGFAGCDDLAHAIIEGKAESGACPVGGSEVASKIAEILGVSADNQNRQVAFVKCAGDCEKAKQSYDYYGNLTCKSVAMLPNQGSKACSYGCTGFGDCVKACPFDAIHVVDGIAVVDREKCKACGKCVAVCPKHLIELIPYSAKYFVQCNSKDKGKDVMNKCSVGCIACSLCVKNCEYDAVSVKDNLAVIDTSKCQSCGSCAEKCPKKIITGNNPEND